MSTLALAQGGPRLSEGLPCTLQPNPMLLAAPPAQRTRSLLAAGLVYCALGSALVILAKDQVRVSHEFHTRHDFTLTDPVEARPLLPPPPVARVAGNNMRPPGAPVTERPVLPDQLPQVTPALLPSVDHSHDGQFTKDMPVSPEGTGKVVVGPEVAPVPQATAPVLVDVTSMRVLSQVQPNYPALARTARLQGPVVLLMTVDASGIPAQVQVLSGPHPTLSNEALRVARLWRFEPARVDGRAVAAQFHLTVVFKLAN